ncbi:MAG: hypothetical protein NTW50_03715 [Candidatus Berkelbacteria bacterium]|nr:hypothetical protein [Candidatus Berkelbacteria bacterium]
MYITQAMFDALAEEFEEDSIVPELLGSTLTQGFRLYHDQMYLDGVVVNLVGDLPVSDDDLFQIIDQLILEFGPKESPKVVDHSQAIRDSNPISVAYKLDLVAIYACIFGNYLRAKDSYLHPSNKKDPPHEYVGVIIDQLIHWNITTQIGHAHSDELYESFVISTGSRIMSRFEEMLDSKLVEDKRFAISLSIA